MISVDFVDVGVVLDRLRGMGDVSISGVARAIAKLGIDLQNNVQQNKLSGQVLQVRSGSLRQSIALHINQSNTAINATVYSDLGYAAAQENGSTGTVDVRASIRQVKEAFGHPIAAKTIAVGAYSRRMDLPQRSFLRTALDDMTPDIDASVQDALREALSK